MDTAFSKRETGLNIIMKAIRYNAVTKDRVENCKKLKDKKKHQNQIIKKKKTEFYKALAQSDLCIDRHRKALNNETENGARYEEWKLPATR